MDSKTAIVKKKSSDRDVGVVDRDEPQRKKKGNPVPEKSSDRDIGVVDRDEPKRKKKRNPVPEESSNRDVGVVDRDEPQRNKKRNPVPEESSDSGVVDRDEPIRKKQKRNPAPESKVTSWEAYNIFLRKLVDQLIDLGASREIKIVAFQLWASYLRLSGVAFVSKDEKKLPALSLAFRNKDAKCLYGVANLRKKLFTRKRKRDNADLSSQESENQANPQESDEQEKKELVDSSDVDCSRQSKMKKGIVFKSSSSKQLKEISTLITECYGRWGRPKMNRKTVTQMRRLVRDRRLCNESQKSPSLPVSIVTLITVVRVALQIVGDEIYLSDILRWICEGRISFKQSHEKLVSYNLSVTNDLLRLKWLGFMMDIRNFTRILGLTQLPTPNLFHLAERYCRELNLPNDILRIVSKLMIITKVSMDYSKYEFRSFPDYECRVMAFVMFALKLTCILDDVTEHHLSDFADLVNESSEDADPAADIPKLFSWRKWVRFVECRKAVLSMYHVPTNDMTYNNGVSSSNVFIDNWDKMNTTYRGTKPICPQILSSLKEECRFLSRQNVQSEEASIHYPVSFTPFKTYTEYLMTNHRKLLESRSRKILSEDFSADSVNMAGNFEWYSDISEKVGLRIRAIDPAGYFDEEHFTWKNTSLLALSKTGVPRADLPVAMLLEDDERPEVIENENIHASHLTMCEHLGRKGGSSSIRICRPLRYWCFHEYHRQIPVEQFEQLAADNFPSSFLWLFRECASMLRASVKELYFELIFVETMVGRLYPKAFRKKIPVIIYENEW